eukprot:933961-Prymnesium_polylepis.1
MGSGAGRIGVFGTVSNFGAFTPLCEHTDALRLTVTHRLARSDQCSQRQRQLLTVVEEHCVLIDGLRTRHHLPGILSRTRTHVSR